MTIARPSTRISSTLQSIGKYQQTMKTLAHTEDTHGYDRFNATRGYVQLNSIYKVTNMSLTYYSVKISQMAVSIQRKRVSPS